MDIKMVIILIVLAIALGLIIYAFIKRDALRKWTETEEAKKLIADLCRKAEAYIIGSKKGQERLEWVVAMLYEYVPPRLKVYFTKEMARAILVKAIQVVFDQISVIFEDGTRRAI